MIVGLQKYIFLYSHNFVLPDPTGAGHVEAFHFLYVGQLVGRSVRQSVYRSVGPSVGLSQAFKVFYCAKLTVSQSLEMG